MGTKIELHSCFDILDSGSGMMVLSEGVETLSDLLTYIAKQIDFNFMDPKTGKLEVDLRFF